MAVCLQCVKLGGAGKLEENEKKKKKKNFPSIVYRKYIIIRVYHSEASIAAS